MVSILRKPSAVGQNRAEKPLVVLHADLERFQESSQFRSTCPVCETGVLPVTRNPETFELTRFDHCTYCGQVFVYDDEAIADEPLPAKRPVLRDVSYETVTRPRTGWERLKDS